MKINDFNNSNRVILFILTLGLLAIIPISVHKTSPPLLRPLDINNNVSTPLYHKSPVRIHPSTTKSNDLRRIKMEKKCNLFEGNWVPNLDMPYYTNETKCVIDNRQNCMKFGRPDTEYMKWRWKPNECEIPLFNAAQFLELVRGKSMAFVGDSVARNQLQSLVCLLTNVTRPLDISHMVEPSERYFYSDYNFSLSHLWTTHLVRAILSPDPFKKLPENVTLDQPDWSWVAEIENYDFVIISSGHWFLKPIRYYEKGKFLGCHICRKEDTTDLNMYHAYRMAFRTSFRTLLNLPKFKGIVFMRTVTGSHVDHGEESWTTEEGYCRWTRPFRREEVKPNMVISEMYSIQVEEFRAAEREGRKKGLKFGLLDVTEPMSLRPDGHPNRYGHWPHVKVRRTDCLHWCLPGPVDVWNEILLQMMNDEFMMEK